MAEYLENHPSEVERLKSAYAHKGEPIPFQHHELFGTFAERLDRSQVCGWVVDLNQTIQEPVRFFLTAWHDKTPQQHLASKGYFKRLADARKHLEEFSAALLATLAILSPMLLPGGVL